MNLAATRKMSRLAAILYPWFPGIMLGYVLIHAVLVLKPVADANEKARQNAASLTMISARVAQLVRTLGTLRQEFDEETSPYQEMLRQFSHWSFEAHTYLNRMAADAHLEVVEMEWGKPELATPLFEPDKNRQWLRTSVFIRLRGAWDAHLDFARKLASSECLLQIVESRMGVAGHPGQLEAAMSFLIYRPGEDVHV